MPVTRHNTPTKECQPSWKGLGGKNLPAPMLAAEVPRLAKQFEDVCDKSTGVGHLVAWQEELFASQTIPCNGSLSDLEQETMATTWLAKSSKPLHATF